MKRKNNETNKKKVQTSESQEELNLRPFVTPPLSHRDSMVNWALVT